MRPSGLNDPKGPRWPDRQPVPPEIKPQKRGGRKVVHIPDEWHEWMRECDRKKGYTVCGRPNRFDEPCENNSPRDARIDGDPLYGRAPCRNHGQQSLAGVANPAYVDGSVARNSRYNLKGKLAGFNDRLMDMEYLSMQADIALVEELTAEPLAALDDPTPCPEPLPEAPMPPDKDGKFSKEAQAHNGRIVQRRMEIEQWHATRAAAQARLDSLLDTKAKLHRVEVVRVKAAQDTLSGGAVRLFAQTMLEVGRDCWLAFGRQHGVPVEAVLAGIAEWQERVVRTIQNARGTGAKRGTEVATGME
jgi:hypothetical protein